MVYSLSERFNQELNIRYINRYNLIPTKICMHTLCMHVSSLLLPIGPFISVCSLLCFLIESLQFCICILNFEQNPASSILQYVRTGKVILKTLAANHVLPERPDTNDDFCGIRVWQACVVDISALVVVDIIFFFFNLANVLFDACVHLYNKCLPSQSTVECPSVRLARLLMQFASLSMG